MKLFLMHLKKSMLLIVASNLVLISCTPRIDTWKPVLEQTLAEEKIQSFEDPIHSTEIRLKLTGFSYNEFRDQISANIAYIMKINAPTLNPLAHIYLRLNDSDGFEIRKFYVGDVVQNFTGALKGNISIEPECFRKIGSAELSILLDPQEKKQISKTKEEHFLAQ